MKTRAAVAFEAKTPLEIVEVDLEGPKTFEVLSLAYVPSPSIAAPTMTTLATPTMTPSRVRNVRNLCARMESIASQLALPMFRQ